MERQVRDIIDNALCQKIGNGFGVDHEVYSGCRYRVDEVMLRTVDLETKIKRIMYAAAGYEKNMDTSNTFGEKCQRKLSKGSFNDDHSMG